MISSDTSLLDNFRQPRAKRVEIAADVGCDVRVEDSGHRALVFAELGQYLTRRFVAEAFLFSTGSLGDPFSDLPDGAYDVARQFTRWHYDGDGERPTYEDFSRAWRSLGDSLLSSAAIPDEELGNCALVVLRAAIRSHPYAAGELYADYFAPNYDRSAESGLRQLLRHQTTSFLATPWRNRLRGGTQKPVRGCRTVTGLIDVSWINWRAAGATGLTS
jgi:hypothetical protein